MSSPGFSSPVELHCLGPRAAATAVALATLAAGCALAAARVPWPAASAALALALAPAAVALARAARSPPVRLRLAAGRSWLIAGGGPPVAVRCTHGWVVGRRVAGLVLASADGCAWSVYLVRSGCPPHGWRRLRAWLACR
jgi:hypothetical protein